MSCGEWCVYYKDRGKTSACFYCSDYISESKPRIEFGKVDIWELARGLQKKREEEQKNIHEIKDEGSSDTNLIIKQTEEYILSICPECKNGSLFYYKKSKTIECLNKNCDSHTLHSAPLIHNQPKVTQIREIKPPSLKPTNLTNPMLLSVKMFLADVIYIVNRKYEEGHVCADFSREVCEAATERDIRCGYVIIYFENNDIAHAIVAFQTDYGLKYFEPQNANEVDVIVGRRYFSSAHGTSDENIVRRVEIIWNDGSESESI